MRKFLIDIFTSYLASIVRTGFYIFAAFAIFLGIRCICPQSVLTKLDSPKAVYVGHRGELLTSTYKNIKKVSSNKVITQDYVFVDEGYTFNGVEKYEKIATYGDKVVYATRDLPLTKVDSRIYTYRKWEDAGLKHPDYDTIEVSVPYNAGLIVDYMKKMHGDLSTYYVSSGMSMKPKGVNVLFYTDFFRTESYHIIESTDEVGYAKYDLYALKGLNITAPPEFLGLEVLPENDDHTDLLLFHSDEDYGVFGIFIIAIVVLLCLSTCIAYLYSHKLDYEEILRDHREELRLGS